MGDQLSMVRWLKEYSPLNSKNIFLVESLKY